MHQGAGTCLHQQHISIFATSTPWRPSRNFISPSRPHVIIRPTFFEKKKKKKSFILGARQQLELQHHPHLKEGGGLPAWATPSQFQPKTHTQGSARTQEAPALPSSAVPFVQALSGAHGLALIHDNTLTRTHAPSPAHRSRSFHPPALQVMNTVEPQMWHRERRHISATSPLPRGCSAWWMLPGY